VANFKKQLVAFWLRLRGNGNRTVLSPTKGKAGEQMGEQNTILKIET